MKGIAGGMWLGMLLALAAKATPMAIAFGTLGTLAAVAAAYMEKQRAASWDRH